MAKEKSEREKAREGDSPKARLLRAKDETLKFTMEDIQKALDDEKTREKYSKEMMPLFLSFTDISKKLDTDKDNISLLEDGVSVLKKLQEKAGELGIGKK